MKMAKILKNRILQDSYLTVFPKFIISLHIYLTFSDRLQKCLSENISHYEDIFCLLSTNKENLSKFSFLLVFFII